MAKLFIIWIAFLPLVVWRSHFEGPKVFYFLVGTIFILLFWIIRILKYKKNFSFSKADYFFIIWLVMLLISSLFGIHPFESVVGGSYRHQGVIFFLALWLIGKTVGILSKTEKIFLAKGVGIAVLVESIIVIFQFLFGSLYFGKSLGTLGEANAVAGFLAIGSYFLHKSFPKLVLVLPAIAILLESSRSGILSLIPNTFMFFEGSVKKFSKPILVLILGVSASLLFSISLNKESSIFENRSLFWKLAGEEIVSKPLLGFGAESGEVVYNKAFERIDITLVDLMVDRTHNLFLDVAMWSGIIGLVIFGGWLCQIFKNTIDIEKKFAILSFLIYAMFQPLSVVHWILLIIIVNI